MKLRLPHKFHAALMAALASVSFTTLSSGTIAVATGAALLAGQQAQADEVLTATFTQDSTTSWTATDTSTYELKASSWTLTKDDGTSVGLKSAPKGQLRPDTNVHTAAGWKISFDITNMGTDTLSLTSVTFHSFMFNGGNNYQNKDQNFNFDISLDAGDGNTTTLTDYNITSNGNYDPPTGVVTVNFHDAITLNGSDSKTITLLIDTPTTGAKGCFVGLTSLSVNGRLDVPAVEWAGTASDNLWSSATAWKGGEGQETGSGATFGADAYNTVVVDKSAQASTVTVDGAAYTFEGSGSVTAQSLAITGDGAGLTLDTSMTLSAQSDYAALAKVTVAEGATLAVNGGASTTSNVPAINLAAGSAGTLELTSGSISYHSNLGGAALQLDTGTTFVFDNNNGTHAYNGDITLAGDATIMVWGVSQHPNGVTFNGDITGSGKTLTKTDGGQLTINGKVDLGTLNLNSASTVVINGSADNKSSIGNLTSVTGSTLTITNTNLGISGGQSFMSNLDIGAGSTVTVKQTDSMKYSGITNTITLREDGVLDFGSFRWTVGNGTTFVMAGGEIKGAGDSNGALDFHQENATIRATADSTISAKLRLRGTTTKFDVNPGATLTLSGVVRDNGSLRKMGAGTLVLSGNAEFSGSTLLDAGTLKVAQGGTLAQGLFTSAAGTRFINEGTATIGKDGADSSLAATVANTGTLTLKGTINVFTTDISAYEVAEAGEMTYSGTGAYAGNGYLSKDTTKYYLVHSTGSGSLTNNATITGVDSSEVQGGNLVFTRNVGATDTYYINSSFTYDETEMGGAANLVIAKGATLNAGGTTSFSSAKVLHGSGTYVLTSGSGLTGNLSLDNNDWTGVVQLSGTYTNMDPTINAADNASRRSKVELKGVTGYFQGNTRTVDANLILTGTGEGGTGDALLINNGSTGATTIFSGSISGAGDFKVTLSSGSNNSTYRFAGDVKDWTGSFRLNKGDKSITAEFQGAANQVNASIVKDNGTLTLATSEGDISFNKAVTATYLTVRAGSTATFNANTTITDGITADGAGTVVVGDGRTLTLGRNAWTTGSDNFATSFVVGGAPP